VPEPSEPHRTDACQARKNIDASHEPRSGTPRAVVWLFEELISKS